MVAPAFFFPFVLTWPFDTQANTCNLVLCFCLLLTLSQSCTTFNEQIFACMMALSCDTGKIMGHAIPGSEGFNAASTETEAEHGDVSERNIELQIQHT